MRSGSSSLYCGACGRAVPRRYDTHQRRNECHPRSLAFCRVYHVDVDTHCARQTAVGYERMHYCTLPTESSDIHGHARQHASTFGINESEGGGCEYFDSKQRSLPTGRGNNIDKAENDILLLSAIGAQHKRSTAISTSSLHLCPKFGCWHVAPLQRTHGARTRAVALGGRIRIHRHRHQGRSTIITMHTRGAATWMGWSGTNQTAPFKGTYDTTEDTNKYEDTPIQHNKAINRPIPQKVKAPRKKKVISSISTVAIPVLLPRKADLSGGVGATLVSLRKTRCQVLLQRPGARC